MGKKSVVNEQETEEKSKSVILNTVEKGKEITLRQFDFIFTVLASAFAGYIIGKRNNQFELF
jgi:hypothetical protein